MQNDKLCMLILSCDKFSDLWDGHIRLLEKYWSNRNIKTFLVTDKPTQKKYKNVEIIAVGENTEWSERLLFAIKSIESEFVLITLDDYFLIKPVKNKKVNYILSFMIKEGFDYVRFYKRPVRATRKAIDGYNNLYMVDTREMYSVNLYTAIWRKEFIMEMANDSLNPWQFEVSLSGKATKYEAKCAVSKNDEFVILDVVRKGKLLHKSYAFFKKHPGIYNGNRSVNSWRYELQLGVKTMVSRHTPKPVNKLIKRIMKRLGYKFIS